MPTCLFPFSAHVCILLERSGIAIRGARLCQGLPGGHSRGQGLCQAVCGTSCQTKREPTETSAAEPTAGTQAAAGERRRGGAVCKSCSSVLFNRLMSPALRPDGTTLQPRNTPDSGGVLPIREMGLTAAPVYPPCMNHILRHSVRLIQFNAFVFV